MSACKAVGCSDFPTEDGWCATHAAYWRDAVPPKRKCIQGCNDTGRRVLIATGESIVCECAPAAAPPTVAPARPKLTAREFARWWLDHECRYGTEREREDMLTKIVNERDRAWQFPSERDRASRSPGPGDEALEGAAMLVGALVRVLRATPKYALSEFDVTTTLPLARRWLETASALRGEGPSPAREGMGPASCPPPLSGLDAATVEAAGLLATLTREARSHYDDDRCDLFDGGLANAMDEADAFLARRALATPPGQAKP